MRLKELSSEVQFILIVFGSILIGFFLRHFKKPTIRKLLPAVIGLTFVVLFCEKQLYHSLLCFLVVTTIIKSRTKYLTILSFVWSFLYMLFMNICHYQGFEKTSFVTKRFHFMLTLKLISISCDISDFRKRRIPKEKSSHSETSSYASKFDDEPSVYDLFMYTYCYVGIFTGPFYTFKTFIDFVNIPSKSVSKIPFYIKNSKKITLLVVSILLYFSFPKLTIYRSLMNESYSDTPFHYRILYPFLVTLKVRFKFYSVWLGAELIFHSLNFGAYPEITKPKPGYGPTCNFNQIYSDGELAMSFNTIKNIDPLKLEKATSVKETMNVWNIATKWWLGHYVLKRFPVKFLRLPAVMLTSAYLHGLDAGYYMATLNIILVLKAEEFLHTHVGTNLPKMLQPLYNLYAWFMTFRAIEYFQVVYHFTFSETIKTWNFMYWYIHIYSIVVIVMLTFFHRTHFSFKPKRS